MARYAHSFAERHPEQRDSIMDLARSNSAFDDLCGRFGRVWDRLNELEGEPGEVDRVRKEVKHLELEMLNLMTGSGRV